MDLNSRFGICWGKERSSIATGFALQVARMRIGRLLLNDLHWNHRDFPLPVFDHQNPLVRRKKALNGAKFRVLG